MITRLANKYKTLPITVRATLWFIVCSVLQKAISIITVPIFTRMLSTYEYGQFSIYNSWLQIFTMICTFRLDYAVFNKGMAKYKENRDEYVSAMQGLTTVITAGVLLVYLLFRKQVNQLTELNTLITLAIFAELFFTPAISFWSLRKRYDFEYKPVVLTTLIMSICNPIIGVVAVYLSENKGYARIMSCILVQICFGLFFYIVNLKKGKKIVNFSFWKFAILFNIPLLSHYFSSYILEQSDRIMIQKLCGLEYVALYSVAFNVGAVIKIVTTSINNALIPWQYRQLEKKNFITLKKSTSLVFTFVAICTVMFSSLAPELMWILGGQNYLDAVYVIPPISASMFFIFCYGIFANVEFYYDATKFTMYISIGCSVINLILNYYGIKFFGYLAASYTSLICYIIFCFGHYMYMREIVKKRYSTSIFSGKTLCVLSVFVIGSSIFMAILYRTIIVRYAVLGIGILICLLFRNKIWEVLKELKN